MSGGLRAALWTVVGLGLVIGLSWLGEGNPLLNAREITVTAGTGTDANAQAVIVDAFHPGGYLAEAAISSSASHAATAVIDGTTLDVYTYDSVFADLGPVRCSMLAHMSADGGGAGSGCPPDSQSSSYIGGGMSGDSTRAGSEPSGYTHILTLVWGPPDGTWLLVETASGDRIKSNVVDGTSISSWHGTFDDYAKEITVYDQNNKVVFSKKGEQGPPLPDMVDVDQVVEAIAGGS